MRDMRVTCGIGGVVVDPSKAFEISEGEVRNRRRSKLRRRFVQIDGRCLKLNQTQMSRNIIL